MEAKRPHSSLPAELTPLVGREHDEAAAVHILSSRGVRLLTLTGPGGVGKTRLAIRAAATLSDRYADGVPFVSLVSLTEPDRVPGFIAMSLGVKDDPGVSTEEILAAWLRHRSILLVVDNFEHVLKAAPVVSDLLEACPRLTVLATSRSPLHVRGEHLLDVPPLQAPDAGDTLPAGVALQYSAMALFVQQARAARADFELTDDLVPSIGEICRRLDGLPLALELAGAQARTMLPEQILRRLQTGTQSLPPGPVDVHPRQKTVRDTIAWSHQLLEEPERRIFRRLSVFVGGWTLKAAESVVAGPADDVSQVLAVLVDKSLINMRQESAGQCYSMLETIRQYSREQAELNDEGEALRAGHADFFRQLAQEAGEAQREANLTQWSSRLLADHENLLAALQWLTEADHVEQALRGRLRPRRVLDPLGVPARST